MPWLGRGKKNITKGFRERVAAYELEEKTLANALKDIFPDHDDKSFNIQVCALW
jgi:uncharacterized protein (UPF0335 family)